VLVRVEASPVSPSDYGFYMGGYGQKGKVKTPPCGLGFEASGEIVELGEGTPESFLHKRIAFNDDVHSENFQGAWRQFIVLQAVPQTFIVFGDHIDYTQISSVFVNPLTVVGFLDVAKKQGYKAIVHSAAASSLGKMVIKLFKKNDVDVINLVRKDEQIEQLQKIGAKYVLNTEAPDFEEKFQKLSDELQPKAFFDCVAGALTGKILNLLPYGSTAYVYGALSKGAVGEIGVAQYIFQGKTITGFWLSAWLKSLTEEDKIKSSGFVVSDLSAGGEIFGTHVAKEYALDDWQQAVKESLTNASEGKVIIRPNK